MSAILTTVPNEQPIGLPGTLVGKAEQVRTYRNGRDTTAGVTDVTITAVNSTDYTVTIDGIAVTITSDGSATAEEIEAALIAAIAANAFAAAKVVGTSGGAGVLRLTEVTPANGATTITVGANLVAAVVTAHQSLEPLGAGIGVYLDLANLDKGCRLPYAGGTFIGVAMHAMYPAQDTDDATTVMWPANSEVPILTRGTILVTVTEDVTPASTPCVRTVAVAGKAVGTWGDTDDGNTEAPTGCRYLSTALSGTVARLALNLT